MLNYELRDILDGNRSLRLPVWREQARINWSVKQLIGGDRKKEAEVMMPGIRWFLSRKVFMDHLER
ncbi:MAG: hypothetical protein QXK32_11810 [Candidatus Jordarchaeales archaeon]